MIIQARVETLKQFQQIFYTLQKSILIHKARTTPTHFALVSVFPVLYSVDTHSLLHFPHEVTLRSTSKGASPATISGTVLCVGNVKQKNRKCGNSCVSVHCGSNTTTTGCISTTGITDVGRSILMKPGETSPRKHCPIRYGTAAALLVGPR